MGVISEELHAEIMMEIDPEIPEGGSYLVSYGNLGAL